MNAIEKFTEKVRKDLFDIGLKKLKQLAMRDELIPYVENFEGKNYNVDYILIEDSGVYYLQIFVDDGFISKSKFELDLP